MFPDDWSADKIKWEVKRAWDSSDFKIEDTKRGVKWDETSPSGIKIEGYLNNKGTRAYPVYEGEN